MHTDIEKLINIARDSGELTEKHKEIILRKAEKLGEDVDEVEMLLETMKPRKKAISSTVNKIEKKIKCPNCGAIISETTFQCPECGYTLQKENEASEDARKMIEKLQLALQKARGTREQAIVINTFALPITKEGLLLLLDFSYSNYVAIGNDASSSSQAPIKKAWYGKTVQAMNMLNRIGERDSEIQAIVSKYNVLIHKEKKKLSHRSKVLWGVAIIYAIIFALVVVFDSVDEKKSEAANEKIEQYLQEGNYQGAKSVARTHFERDRISTYEVLSLISNGDYQQAKVVAATIEDDDKRAEMQKAIVEAEAEANNNP